jgi:hypothetical protein
MSDQHTAVAKLRSGVIESTRFEMSGELNVSKMFQVHR